MESQSHQAKESLSLLKKAAPTIEGSFAPEGEYGDGQNEFPDRESRSMAIQLADVGGMDGDEIRRLSNMNEFDREEEIKTLKKEVRMYLFLMAMIAINSAWYFYTANLIIY